MPVKTWSRSGPAARPPRRVRSLSAALLALLVLAGCGGGDDDDQATVDDESIFDDTVAGQTTVEETTTSAPPPPAAIDACTLVSKQEAEAVAGAALEDATPAPESCTYVGPPTGPVAQFEVYVGDGAYKFLEIDRDLAHEFEPITGAGDEAVIEDGTAFVRKGNVWVALRVVRLDDFAVYKQSLIDLTVAVADRI